MIPLLKLKDITVTIRCSDGDGSTGSGLVHGKVLDVLDGQDDPVLVVKKATLTAPNVVLVPWRAIQYISLSENAYGLADLKNTDD